MITNPLKYILRGFLKDKKFFLNNFLGLTLAFTSILFIYSWIRYEKSFDNFYENSSRIYRFTVENSDGVNTRHFARVRREWIKEFPGYFPEIEEMVRLAPGRNSSLKIGENRFYSKGVFTTDSNFFSVFNVNLLRGNPQNVLDAPKCAVINQSIAQKYFNDIDPIGKKIEWSHQQGENFETYTVMGVMPDFPRNCHFHPEILLSFEDPTQYEQWFYTYLLIKKNADIQSLESKYTSFKETYIENAESRDNEIFHLQNVRDIHLYSQKDREIEPNSEARSIAVLMIVALILILVISLNYMNYKIASVFERNKYFSISKTFGAKNKAFVSQLAIESIILVVVSSIFSLFIYFLTMPGLSNWLNIEFHLPVKETVMIYITALLFFCTIGIVCSIYPVFLLKVNGTISRLNIFQSHLSTTTKEFSARKVLVISQFVGAICLIIATTVIIKQNQYLLSNRIGSGQDNIINLINLPRLAVDKYKIFKEELLRQSSILDVTASMEEPAGEVMDAFRYELEGMAEEDKSKLIYLFPTDHNFNRFYGNKIIAGEDYYNDEINSRKYLVNQAAMKFFGYNNPNDIIGKRFKLIFPYENFFNEGTIAGVINDFHITSMQNQEKPIVLYHQPYFIYCVGIKFDPYHPGEALEAIRKTWSEVNPDFAFESYFIDDLYVKLYENQIRQSRFLTLLAIVALFISSLGLFSIAVYNIRKRTKEIGIRKVNGAKTGEVIVLLNQTFLKWVTIAYLLAVPAAWYAMHRWLNNFAYKTTLSWWIFVLAGLLVLGIAMLTISFQSFKAAMKNPVEAIRYE